jgi:hypothetical protein
LRLRAEEDRHGSGAKTIADVMLYQKASVKDYLVFGKDLATAVGAEDAHLRLDLFTRLAAPAHLVLLLVIQGTIQDQIA